MKAYLGIDVSKGYADFALIGLDFKAIEKGFHLHDNKEGRQVLKELIGSWLEQGLFDALHCAVESTGGYENNWYNLLRSLANEFPLKVARLNPRGIKANGDAELIRSINDEVSANLIASYLIRFPDKVHYSNQELESTQECKEGRQFLRCVQMLTKQKVQLGNQLEKLLYEHLGELLVYCRNGYPNWLLRLLSKYPSREKLMRAGVSRICKVKGVSQAKAEAILKKVKSKTLIQSSLIPNLIQMRCKKILSCIEEIKEHKKLINDMFKNHQDVKLLTSIPGMGIATAVELYFEIEHIERFESAKRLCSFFGVHPTYKASGDGKWKVGMSKKGRANVRGKLFMVGLTAIRDNPSIKQSYHRFRLKGMNHYQAMGVVMHKILRVVFGVLQSRTQYDQEIDDINVEQAEAKRKEYLEEAKKNMAIIKKSRHRFQATTLNAPISQQKANKTKKQMASQLGET